jgi:two-component system, LuxR family, response regulator FixJ
MMSESEAGKVYIIDDDEAVRDSLSWLMQSAGIDAQTFDSAGVFLEACNERLNGCLLLDIRMPGMSGLELQAALNQRGCHMPVIVISGHADVPMAVRALKAGAFDFIEKPFNDDILLALVQRALEQESQLRQSLAEKELMQAKMESLTPRELEVLERVVAGASNKQIGAELGVSQKTVEAHRAKVMEKLEAASLSHLVRMAVSLRDLSADAAPGAHGGGDD